MNLTGDREHFDISGKTWDWGTRSLVEQKRIIESEVYYNSKSNKLLTSGKVQIWSHQEPEQIELPLNLSVGYSVGYHHLTHNVYLDASFSQDAHTQKFLCDRDGGVSCELYGYYVLRFYGSKFVYAYPLDGGDCLEYEASWCGLRGYQDNPEYAEEFKQIMESAIFE